MPAPFVVDFFLDESRVLEGFRILDLKPADGLFDGSHWRRLLPCGRATSGAPRGLPVVPLLVVRDSQLLGIVAQLAFRASCTAFKRRKVDLQMLATFLDHSASAPLGVLD